MERDQTRERERNQQYQQDRSRDDLNQGHDDQGGQGGVERSGSTSTSMTRSGESGGDWQGFVVPYRYYGPGYAGLGYYAVYYQGGAGQREQGEETQGFDQRNVRNAQGQGAGGALQSSGQSAGGQWQNEGGRGGGYAGRGPKGYRRSDERIREEISDQFMEDDQLDASDIEVNVQDGVVTLTGTVEDRRSKRMAEDMAERASGVRDVMNNLKVGGQDSPWGGHDQGTTAGAESGTSATGSRSRSATSDPSSRASSQSRAPSGRAQPVGSRAGGASDGSTGNGSSSEDPKTASGGSR